MNKLPTYPQPFVCFRPARPFTASTGLGSDVSSNLSITINTWKLPDISSLHNVIRTGIRPFDRCKLLFLYQDMTFHQVNGGAERDRTADPLLAKQVLSQLSYSPSPSTSTRRSKENMVGPGRLELPTPRLSSVCSNRLSYGPDLRVHADTLLWGAANQTKIRPPNRARGPRASWRAPSGAQRPKAATA